MMKRVILAAVAAIGLAGAANAEPLLGLWQTIGDDNGNYGHIQVAPCGAQICGTLVKSFNSAGQEIDSPNTGRTIISETVPTGGGEYRGKVYSPDRDKTYNSRLNLSGNTLQVRGCVFGICRDGGSWTRLN